MPEQFKDNFFKELDESDASFQRSLFVSVQDFLLERRFGVSYTGNIADRVTASLGTQPKVPIEKSTEVDFHSSNMLKCKNLRELERYARENGFGWVDEEEMEKCKTQAIADMASISDAMNLDED